MATASDPSHGGPAWRAVGRALGLVGRGLAAVSEELALEAPGIAREMLGLAAYATGRIGRAPYQRLIGLRGTAEFFLRIGDLATAEAFGRQLLALAERFPNDWYYGNAVHHGHLVLGRIAVQRGERSLAGQEMLAAGRTPGSPQLNSFGPNMRLAADLLRVGEREVVLEYFDLCAKFWTRTPSPLPAWAERVRQGEMPAFGPNLVY